MSDWVKFHAELRKGMKRELSRATRFVYLELCSEARRTRGVLQLRADLPLAEAVNDAIGGDRRALREVRDALRVLNDARFSMITVNEGERTLTINAWAKWNAVDVSTERVRAHRARRNGDETRFTAVPETQRNGSETEPEERRGEEKRSPQTPHRGPAASAPAETARAAGGGSAPEPPEAFGRGEPDPDRTPEGSRYVPAPPGVRAAMSRAAQSLALAAGANDGPRDKQAELEKFYLEYPDARPKAGGDDR